MNSKQRATREGNRGLERPVVPTGRSTSFFVLLFLPSLIPLHSWLRECKCVHSCKACFHVAPSLLGKKSRSLSGHDRIIMIIGSCRWKKKIPQNFLIKVDPKIPPLSSATRHPWATAGEDAGPCSGGRMDAPALP